MQFYLHKIKLYTPNNAVFKGILIYLEARTDGQKSQGKLIRDTQKNKQKKVITILPLKHLTFLNV